MMSSSHQPVPQLVADTTVPRTVAEMMLTCFINAGRMGQAERLLDTIPSNQAADLRFELGMAYAERGQLDAAMTHFKAVVKSEPAHTRGRQAAVDVLRLRIAERVGQQDWEGAARLIREALTLAPADALLEQCARAVEAALPARHMARNELREAAELWEKMQSASPGDFQATHQLALLYHRWAIETEEHDRQAPEQHWQRAIANWGAIVGSDAFWNAWQAEREKVYGAAIDPNELYRLRFETLRERLEHVHRDFEAGYIQAGRPSDGERHARWRTVLRLEFKAVMAYRETVALLQQRGKRVEPPIYGGPLFLAHIHRLDEARRVAHLALQVAPDAQPPQALNAYLSSLGWLRLLVEDRQIDRALPELRELAKNKKNSEAIRLLVKALTEWGNSMAASDIEKAVAAWAEAATYGADAARLRETIAKACLEKANELQRDDPAHAMVVLRLGLRHAPNNGALKQSLSAHLNILAVQYASRQDWDQALAALEEAVQLDGHNNMARENLAKVREAQRLARLEPILEDLNAERYDQAIAQLLVLLPHAPSREARDLLGQVYRERGVTRANAGNWSGALADMQQALVYQPDNANFKADLSIVCRNRALEIAAEAANLLAYDRWGACQRLGQAQEVLELGARNDPHDSATRTTLAEVREARRRLGC